MGVFSANGIGIDPGSSNFTIALEGEGVVLREPSYVLSTRTDTDDVLFVGREARQMLGRTPKDVALISPMMGGAVTDDHLAATLMLRLSEKAIGRRRALEKSRLVVTHTQGITRIERRALEDVVRASGSKKAALLSAAAAAAIGAGVPIGDPRGAMVVNIGGETTDISVFSLYGIAANRSIRMGSAAWDSAIIRAVRREKNLIIGQRTAEDLKIDLGSLDFESVNHADVALLRGRDALSGRPASVEITASEIQRALLPHAEELLESIREAFENIPADLAGGILESGITLTGGGALLDGLPAHLSQLMNLPVHVGEEPQDETALGACSVAADDKLARQLEATGCLIEL